MSEVSSRRNRPRNQIGGKARGLVMWACCSCSFGRICAEATQEGECVVRDFRARSQQRERAKKKRSKTAPGYSRSRTAAHQRIVDLSVLNALPSVCRRLPPVDCDVPQHCHVQWLRTFSCSTRCPAGSVLRCLQLSVQAPLEDAADFKEPGAKCAATVRSR